MLTSTRLGDEARLAHPAREQRLPEDVVDLVRARVVQVLALQQQPDAEAGPEVLALGERRRAACVIAQQVVELGAERRVGPRIAERGLELLARGDESLGDEAPAELAEPTLGVRVPHERRHSSCQS